MTDLEMLRLCADAIGIDCGLAAEMGADDDETGLIVAFAQVCSVGPKYDPLHDDAQAMALVKRFDLAVWGHSWAHGAWKYHAEYSPDGDGANSILGHGDNHNRAIVVCVAKMQAASTSLRKGTDGT